MNELLRTRDRRVSGTYITIHFFVWFKMIAKYSFARFVSPFAFGFGYLLDSSNIPNDRE